MNEMQIFTNNLFGGVRAIKGEDGKAWFVGRDIADALGYIGKASNNAVANHCKGVIQIVTPTNGGYQSLKYINEYDVIRLIMKSKLPKAQAFEKWIVEEVIPAILQTGEYSIKQDSYMIQDPIERAKRWIEEQQVTVELQGQLEIAQPKVDAYDEFMESDGTFTTTNACKMLGFNRARVFEWLRAEGLVYKNKTEATAIAIRKGYFKQIIKSTHPTMVITPLGVEYLRNNYCDLAA